MSDKVDGNNLVKDIVYSLCESSLISGDTYKSILLSITMLSDDRITSEQKAKINFELTLFFADILSMNNTERDELIEKGAYL